MPSCIALCSLSGGYRETVACVWNARAHTMPVPGFERLEGVEQRRALLR